MEMRRSHVAGKVRHLWLDLLRDQSRDDVGVVNYRVTGTGVSVSWVVMLCMVMMHTSWGTWEMSAGGAESYIANLNCK
jgi:hypothetical protein